MIVNKMENISAEHSFCNSVSFESAGFKWYQLGTVLIQIVPTQMVPASNSAVLNDASFKWCQF